MGVGPLDIGSYPSRNYAEADRRPGDIPGIVVHDTESTSTAALAWLTNPVSEVSAHYLIAEAGGIYELVPPRHVGFHASAFGRDPSKNRNQPTWLPPYDGGPYSSTNKHTVGIELAGFASQGFRPIQYQALGLLCAQLCREWGIPPTLLPEHGAAARITTHAYLQTDRSDPGPHFDWGQFKTHLVHYLAEGGEDMGIIEELSKQKADLEAEIRHLNGVNTTLAAQRDNCEGLKQQVEGELRAALEQVTGERDTLTKEVAALTEALANAPTSSGRPIHVTVMTEDSRDFEGVLEEVQQ
jgi:N-acetyl-anhydromuramyl-L-alanine amidase AmpD